jgi:hypothetical protein
MPYSKLADARMKKLKGIPLTLGQINAIARMADAIGGDFGWPTAIKKFEEGHEVSNGHWISKKEYEGDNFAVVHKEADGRYLITAVSTAALKDQEGETYSTAAMDYEIKMAELTGEYPEFTVFHKKLLKIGKVEKMRRVGIFAVDEGHSYDDPFSRDVCEKMLTDNADGKWRMSRGFYVIELAGKCPTCSSTLGIKQKHMIFGFKCPTCDNYISGYKRVLKEIRYLKTKTFDCTITDIPCVPYTGVTAIKEYSNMEEGIMDRKQLKERLLKAGLSEVVIDSRLKEFTDEQLKEFDGIPEAEVLKEFEDAPADADEEEGDTLVLDESVLKEFTDITIAAVELKFKELMDGLTVETEDADPAVNLKEIPEFQKLVTDVAEIKEMLSKLTISDDQRLKEMLTETPRNGKLRVMRVVKSKPAKPVDEEDEDWIDEEDGEEPPAKSKKAMKEGIIRDSDGNVVESMTDFITGGK